MIEIKQRVWVNASADRAWAVVGDLADVGSWVPGVTDVQVAADRRICTFANGHVQHERISEYAPESRSYRFMVENAPFPARGFRCRIGVEPDGTGAAVALEVEGEALDPSEESDLTRMLDGAYAEALESLRRRIEEPLRATRA